MELKVYDGEHFERGKLWYVIFALIIFAVILGSVCSKNITGGILILAITGGYFFYSSKFNTPIQMKIGRNALQIGSAAYPRNMFSGFVLEYNTEKKIIQNIVLVGANASPRIYTIADKEKNLKNFVDELTDYLPILDKYEQKGIDKFIRKIKL